MGGTEEMKHSWRSEASLRMSRIILNTKWNHIGTDSTMDTGGHYCISFLGLRNAMRKARGNHLIIPSKIIMVIRTNKGTIIHHGSPKPLGRKGQDLSGRQSAKSLREIRIDKIRLTKTKMGAWNVRSMSQPGKMHNDIKEMKRLNIRNKRSKMALLK